MYTYTATIGRNVGDTPMSDSDWEIFIDDVTADMSNSAWPNQIEAVEIHRGVGVWNAMSEESAKITLLLKSALPEDGERSLNVLRGYLTENARQYGQDAIALTIGQSELIEPVRSWDVCPICGNSGSAPGWLTVHTCYAP